MRVSHFIGGTMKVQKFFDINDNESMSNYLHLPITRDRNYWDKSIIELYDFVISRIERDNISINKENVERLIMRMCMDNGPTDIYIPFNKSIINNYLCATRKIVEKNKKRPIDVDELTLSLNEMIDQSKTNGLIACGDASWPYMLGDVIISLLKEARNISELEDNNKVWTIISIVLEEMSNICGGRSYYIPRLGRIRSAIREVKLFEEFNGRNIPYLARKYRISGVRIYQALKNQRAYQSQYK